MWKRSLKYGLCINILKVPNSIVTCSVLHNFRVINNEIPFNGDDDYWDTIPDRSDRVNSINTGNFARASIIRRYFNA